MKNTLTALILLLIIACNNNKSKDTPTNIPANYWENSIELRIQDTDGTDLLNSNNQGHYESSDIKITNAIDEQNAVTINKYPNDDFYYVRLNLNYNKINIDKGKEYQDEVTTQVTFGNNNTDQIKAVFEVKYSEGNNTGLGTGSGYCIRLQKAWFNGILAYDNQEIKEPDWEIPTIIMVPNK